MEAGAPKNDAKAQAEDDLSMEEILQSIRRIIAEDEKGEPAEVPGSDVLELTEMLNDDGSVVSLSPAEPVTPPPSAITHANPADVLSAIDAVLSAPAPVAPLPEPVRIAAEPAPVMPEASVIDDKTFLSDAAALASAAAFSRLRTTPQPASPAPAPSAQFRSGTTVEDLVTEMLRPMMKAWLDENLPGIVERIVEREVRRVSK